MPTSTAFALSIASVFPGFFLLFYITKMANHAGDEIVTGVANGSPISIKHRRNKLYDTYLPYALGAVGCGFLIVAVNVQIAAQATDTGVEPVAYLAAFFGGIASLVWILQGSRAIIDHRRLLSETEPDE